MLRLIVQTNAQAARSYYQGSVGSGGEYYAEGQEQAGEWGGLTAKRLGLEGHVEKGAFDALCENQKPGSTERLTARTKTIRRVGFDLNFHVPKSVSVVYGLTGNRKVLDAFKTAVRETLGDLEIETRTRIRTNGQDETRITGNMAYALFVHATSRPVGGIPDPHLHAHAFVFNVTHCEMENRFKAIELGDVYKNAPFYEALFHARFSKTLVGLGFDISRSGSGWEISGIPSRVLKSFSRRTEQIESLANELGIDDPSLKAALGAKTRERKQLRFTLEELRTIWRNQLSHDERRALDHVHNLEIIVQKEVHAARDAVAFAVAHCFERSSVLPYNRFLEAALRHGVGHVTLEEIENELSRNGVIVRDYIGERLATTKEVLSEEQRILSFAKNGRAVCRPLVTGNSSIDDRLSPSQQSAFSHVLSSPDRVILIRGVAGSGKTTLIKECVHVIEGNGKTVLLLAPSAEASRGVLRKEGFTKADTVAKFLLDERIQETVRNGVVWIDEAGLLGLKTLDAVFAVAGKLEARVILSGDDRQHHSVERGTPFTLLQQLAGLEPATVKEIRRQTGRYKKAVELLSEGKTVVGFDLLDKELGWVNELSNEDRAQAMSQDYLKAFDNGKSVLAVSPTHAEGLVMTRTIRSALREAGKLTGNELEFTRLEARDLTTAEREEPRFYREGDVIEFHSQAKGFRPGSRFSVTMVGRSSIAARDEEGRETILPLRLADRFQVYTQKTITLAIGDRIRITKNGKCKNQKRLDNGMLLRIVDLKTDGSIELENGISVSQNFAHLTHGYVVTSHASQGKTVDRVLIAQSSESFPASSREQFYVSVSRARESATIYTDDVVRLRRAIERSDPNLSASELVLTQDPPMHVWRAWVSKRLQSLRSFIENGMTQLDPSLGHGIEILMRPR